MELVGLSPFSFARGTKVMARILAVAFIGSQLLITAMAAADEPSDAPTSVVAGPLLSGDGAELQLTQAGDPLNTTVENPSPDGEPQGEVFVSPETATDPLNTTIENPTVEPLGRHNGFDLKIDETKKVNVGAGIRASFNAIEDSSPNQRMWSRDVNLDNVRIYINGKAHEYIGFEVNTDINNAQPLLEDTLFPDGGNIRLLDAVGKLEINSLFNIWIGRFLPPSDRSNLSGPFFLNAYTFPFTQVGYPNIFQGREDGVAYWGEIGEGKFKWQTGIFRGREGFPNVDDHLMYTARLVLNLLDPEPGYYNQSTYYGQKNILAIGAAMMYQQDAVGSIDDPRSFTGWSIDALFETKLANDGVVSVEGASYNFNDGGVNFVETSPGVIDVLNRQGNSFFILLAYLFPRKVGVGIVQGQLQPHVRFQYYERDFKAPGFFDQGLDIGTHYVIDGANARLTLVYQSRAPWTNGQHIDHILFGTQFQF